MLKFIITNAVIQPPLFPRSVHTDALTGELFGEGNRQMEDGMGNTKFTPGPWRADFSRDDTIRIRAEASDALVATSDDGGHPEIELIGREEQEANARLIAAAPDMYEALLAMATRHKDSPYIGMARAALAKANPPTA